jgi:hypothetical protein
MGMHFISNVETCSPEHILIAWLAWIFDETGCGRPTARANRDVTKLYSPPVLYELFYILYLIPYV